MPDAHTIRRYLDALAIDPAEPQTWQTFPDRKDSRARPQHRCVRLVDALRWMSDAQGAGGGVFLTVNATNGGRKAADVVGVRCLFVDVDTEQPEPKWHLEPACVVQSSPGKWHAYWRVADRMPLEAFSAAQRRLALLYGGDAACHDLSRVLRVPGTDHCKAGRRPVLLHSVSAWGIYPWREVLAGVPELPAEPVRAAPSAVRAAAEALPGGMTDGIDVTTLDLPAMMRDAGLDRGVWRSGGMAVECPWSAEHSGPSGATAAMVWPPGARGELPGFKCQHAHCEGRGLRDVMRLFARQLSAYAKPQQQPHRAVQRGSDRLARLRRAQEAA